MFHLPSERATSKSILHIAHTNASFAFADTILHKGLLQQHDEPHYAPPNFPSALFPRPITGLKPCLFLSVVTTARSVRKDRGRFTIFFFLDLPHAPRLLNITPPYNAAPPAPLKKPVLVGMLEDNRSSPPKWAPFSQVGGTGQGFHFRGSPPNWGGWFGTLPCTTTPVP